MKCHICSKDVEYIRSVMLRPWLNCPSMNSAAYQQYCKDMTFRRAFICGACYHVLDGSCGVAEIAGDGMSCGKWSLAGSSRGGNAVLYDHKKYDSYQRTAAAKMGLSV